MDQTTSIVSSVEHALQALFDSDELQKSPLIVLLGLKVERGASPLRQLLIDAIETLKPQTPGAQTGKAWRSYRVLYQRYVGQLSRTEVAEDLGLSIRQVVREDDRAIYLLTDYLRSRYNLEASGSPASSSTAPAAASPSADVSSRDQELQWLEASRRNEEVSVAEQIGAAIATINPLIQAHNVKTDISIDNDLPPVPVPGDVLRQALINILAAMIAVVAGGTISIAARLVHHHIRVFIRLAASTPLPDQPQSQDILDSLDMAGKLLGLMGGVVEALPREDEHEIFAVALSLRLPHSRVLVIDDNADALRLFERYLADSRYKFVGCHEASEAVRMAESLQPQIIIVDVMLPGIDGWELLQRLRVSPASHDTPIVVCSILPAEKLALTLGAVAYLRKPVTQHDFLATLDGLARE